MGPASTPSGDADGSSWPPLSALYGLSGGTRAYYLPQPTRHRRDAEQRLQAHSFGLGCGPPRLVTLDSGLFLGIAHVSSDGDALLLPALQSRITQLSPDAIQAELQDSWQR
jgi:hypothetical protein